MKDQPKKLFEVLKPWAIICCGGFFYCYQFIIRVSPNVMHNELLNVFAIDVLALGLILGAYNWAYSLMQIPLGLSIDRFGPKYFLTGASLFCAMGCFLFSVVTNPFMAAVARFLMGMGSACGLIGTIKLGTLWLNPKHIGKVVGLTMAFGTVGASLGGTPLSLFVDKYGFRFSMQVLGIIGLILSGIIFLVVSNRRAAQTEAVKKTTRKFSFSDDLKLLVKNPQTWLLSFYGMFMYAPITIMGVGWGVPFIEKACDVSEATAGAIITSMFIGAAFGGPIFASTSDLIKMRKLPMFIGSISTAILYFTIILVPNMPISLMYILFFIVGFMYTAKTLTFASICEIMPLKMTGVSVAFVNGLVMAAGIFFHPLIGMLISWHASMEGASSNASYSLGDFRFALLVVPIVLTISGILLLFIKESHPEYESKTIYGQDMV